MKCRRWISANSQEIISERAAFHYWKSGKSKEIKQMVYYSKISEEVGVVLCREVTVNMSPQHGFWPVSAEAFAQHGAGGADAGGEKELVVPGPEKAEGDALVLCLAAGKLGACTAFSVSWQLLPWVTPREPGGLSAQSLSNPGDKPLGWVSRDKELWDQWS